MITYPTKKTIDDYPPLNRSAEDGNEESKFDDDDESSSSLLKDKQPAGDAGPEDAIDEKEKKADPPY